MGRLQANQVADWFLSKINTASGDTISPLKLQKLIYYAQAWHLAIFDEPIFDEDIQAWMHGPVVPSVYYRFQETCKDCTIDISETPLDLVKLDANTEQLFNEINSIYGERSARYLEALTHSEDPWIIARGGLPLHERSNNVIKKELMSAYYKAKNQASA